MPIPVNPIYDNSNISVILPQPAAAPVPEPQTGQAEPTTTPAVNPASPQAASAQLQSQLDESLKNSGIKAEIENEKAGLVVVRFVQAGTGRVILQMPPQGVLDLVAQMEHQPESSPLAGNMVDTSV